MAWTLLFTGLGAGACTYFPLDHPAPLQTVAEARPVLRWRGDAAGSYRVQVAVLRPEAGLLAAHDLLVQGTQWTLPQDLAAPHAAVKVLVSRNCPQLQAHDLHARGPAFFVDLRGTCQASAPVLDASSGRISWARVPDAQAYRVRVFRTGPLSGASSELAWSTELPASELPAARPLQAGEVITVQPLCDGRPGTSAALALPP